jgi:uncharacterized membrane protein YqjE
MGACSRGALLLLAVVLLLAAVLLLLVVWMRWAAAAMRWAAVLAIIGCRWPLQDSSASKAAAVCFLPARLAAAGQRPWKH